MTAEEKPGDHQGHAEFLEELGRELHSNCATADKNLAWLGSNLHPYFFITMRHESQALVNLAAGLHTITSGRRLVLAEEGKKLIVAALSEPGSFYESLRAFGRHGVSYAELTHSYRNVPGTDRPLEVQKFESDLKHNLEIDDVNGELPELSQVRDLRGVLTRLYRDYDFRDFERDLLILRRNNEQYVRISPPERTARILWLHQMGKRFDGLFLDAEKAEEGRRETRLVFAVVNPSEKDFLSQVMEVFHRLRIGVQRSYILAIHDGESPCFLGTFYVTKRRGGLLVKDSPLFQSLKAELYNTQIVSTTSRPYTDFVAGGMMTGEEASLTNAFISFCFTSLAHNHPDRYHLTEVVGAFMAGPEIARVLCRLFRLRFDPTVSSRQKKFRAALRKAQAAVDGYNTGHRHLDEVRRTVYRTALLFIRHTLKTNFYVFEKHALAFRLDPRYLGDLGEEFTADLPDGEPFRVTFFSGRHGTGYHVGFADIARGGWRTVVCRDGDDYNETVENLFREVYVLAHTQHLKNKDIYEGGSKMVVALDVSDAVDDSHEIQRLYKLQYGFINAFLDLFSLKGGESCHPQVVDYYGQEEAIELGPDENMHDTMIEKIARQAVKRKYLLGPGIISSKRVGINHKHYGVTSIGVFTFARVTMKELGVDIGSDPFAVKLTGGPAGDVAGNTLRLLLENCPRVKVKLVIDGSGLLYDPGGMDRRELRRLLMRDDIGSFRPEKIGKGGFLLSRRKMKRQGLQDLYCRFVSRSGGVVKTWVTADEMHREFDELLFSVPTDLFIPAGGRPETVDDSNWERFIIEGGKASCRAIVEGANSFLTSGARDALQKGGVVIIRDASANKCGVISSSYEIIANLLMSDEEFLAFKEPYVADVLGILEKRVADEAHLLFRRHREQEGRISFTALSDALSREINDLYARLFEFLQDRPKTLSRPSYRRVLKSHLPAFVVQHPRFRRRIGRLPLKYRCAMIASEIAARIVYGGGWETDFEKSVDEYVAGEFRD